MWKHYDANVFPRASYLSAFAPPSLRDTVCGAPNARTNARRRHLAGHAFEDGVDDGCSVGAADGDGLGSAVGAELGAELIEKVPVKPWYS